MLIQKAQNQHASSGLGCSVRKQKCPHKSFLLPALYSTGCNELLAGSLIYIVQQQSIWWFICSGRQRSVTAQSGCRARAAVRSGTRVFFLRGCWITMWVWALLCELCPWLFFNLSANRDKEVFVSRKYWWLNTLSGKSRMSKGLQSHQP